MIEINQNGGGFPIVFIIAGIFAIGVVTYIVMTSTSKPTATTSAPITKPPIATTKPVNTTSNVSNKPLPTVPGSRTQAGSTSDFSFDPRALTGSYTLPPSLMAEDATSLYGAPQATLPPCPVKNQVYSVTMNSCVCLPDYDFMVLNNLPTCVERCVYNGQTVGYVDPETKKCVCKSGRTGSKCQCSESSRPMQNQNDLCMGNAYTCIDDGVSLDKWTKTSSFETCDSLYGLINGKDKGTEKEWKDTCYGILIDPEMTGEINCTVNSTLKTAKVSISQSCSKIPPASLVLTQADICNGLGIVCTGNNPTGPNRGWEKQLIASTCDKLYGLATNNPTDTFDNWLGVCKSVPGVGNQNMNTINKFSCYKDSKTGMYGITSKSMCTLNPPSGLSNITKCSGLGWVCDMNVGGWKIQPTNTSCSSLFGQISNKDEDFQVNWENKCKNLVANPNYINKFTCSLNTTGFAIMDVKQLCPITVPSTLKFTDTDKCNGLGPVCTGSTGQSAINGWEKGLVTSSCDALYGMISGKKTDNEMNWLTKCNKLLTDPKYQSSVTCTTNENDNAYVNVEKLCSLNPPADAPKCTFGSVLLCDASTNSKWMCVPQKIITAKCVPPVGSLCASDGKSTDPNDPSTQLKPICVSCGFTLNAKGARVDSYELTCENTPPSFECVKNANNLRTNDDARISLPNADQNDEPVSLWLDGQNVPIYPTVDNDICLSNIVPNNTLQREGYQGFQAVPNPNGFISSHEGVKKFYPTDARPGAPKRLSYVAPGEKGVCFYTPKEIVKDLGGSGTKVCTDRGKYTQDADTKHSYATGLKSGRCSCNTYSYVNGLGQNVANKTYLGSNCQFSDIEQCSKNGTAVVTTTKDAAGNYINTVTCKCLPGFVGSKCQYSRKHCFDKGTPTVDANDNLVCNCENGRDPLIYCKDCPSYTYKPVNSMNAQGNNLSEIIKRAVGPNCEYKDNTTCDSKGIANEKGTCTGYYYESEYLDKALAQYLGPKLEYNDNKTCNQKGSATSTGTCSKCKENRNPSNSCKTCVAGYGGTNCNKTKTDCNYGDLKSNDPTETTLCTCKDGYDPATNCSKCNDTTMDPAQKCSVCKKGSQFKPYACETACTNGNLSYSSGCTLCNKSSNAANYDTADCSLCKPGYGGTDCGATKATCNGRGNLAFGNVPSKYDGKNVCTCDGNWDPATNCLSCKSGWFGDNCQYSNATTCNGHGKTDYWGKCTCDAGWDGDKDHQCKYNRKACTDKTYGYCDKDCCESSCWGTCHKWHHTVYYDINMATGVCNSNNVEDCHCTGSGCGCC